MKKLLIVAFSIGMLILCFFVLWLMQFSYHYRGKIFPGITIEGVPVSQKSKEEALAILENRYPSKKEVALIFTFRGEPIATVSGQQLAYTLPLHEAVQQALNVGREQNQSVVQHSITRLQLITGIQGYRIALQPRYNEATVEKKIRELADAYHTEPINARFEFMNNKVIAFAKEQPGYYLDTTTLKETVLQYLSSPATKQLPKDVQYVSIQRKTLQPRLRLKDSNSLGIVELVASGSSRFAGSIPERIHNITIGSQRLNGTIIKKGETFSFVRALGDISRATGFKPAYIIRNGRTVLDDGGGICQVSTTIFRTALNAGLPIVERNAHAYRVGYYEQDMPPGFDATIYSPSIDLRFENNYGSALLIQTVVNPENATLDVYMYGTKDSRIVTVGTPVVSNQSAPPPAEYIDEPTLPQGVVKQVDFSAPGALSRFTYQVQKDNKKIIDQVFVSQYRPWKAIYLRGTQ